MFWIPKPTPENFKIYINACNYTLELKYELPKVTGKLVPLNRHSGKKTNWHFWSLYKQQDKGSI